MQIIKCIVHKIMGAIAPILTTALIFLLKSLIIPFSLKMGLQIILDVGMVAISLLKKL